MKKAILLLSFFVFLCLCGCSLQNNNSFSNNYSEELQSIENSSNNISYINPQGMTIETRVLVPDGFSRTQADEYGVFIRNLPLLPDNSPILMYNGSKKGNQNIHIAVVDIDVGNRDLQQCADSALRIRCEYLFSTGQYDKINYHLTNGDEFPYVKYRDGYRLNVEGNKTSLVKTSDYSNSYETFRKYLDVLYCYAGTLSISAESKLVDKTEMKIGDIFIKGGSPGHCVIVMDMCENAKGEKMFLLGQGYSPAQQIHLLKNPGSSCPWYSLDELSYPFGTPEYTFYEECLKRMP